RSPPWSRARRLRTPRGATWCHGSDGHRDRRRAHRAGAWVEYLRATGSPAHLRLRELIAAAGELATTEVVTMELLAGVATAEAVTRLRRLLLRFQLLPIEGLADYEAAAALYRHCRARGETVRSTVDCLIAVVAMRHRATLLHRDHDFEVIARHTPLRTAGAGR
ncbi:MAG TPA: PIN domain nuclease, partial [Actinomycetota bacterium]|nr:PIN domain nuclease [Actinomycetota bacterium]